MAKQMTKAQVIDENIRLRAQCNVLENKVHELTEQLEAAHVAKHMPAASHPDYWSYVRAVKREQRDRGVRVFSYMSRDQWIQARGH